MDQELIAYLDKRFQGVDERFQQASDQIQVLRDELRQTDVKVEDLRGKIELVAEGVAGVDEKLQTFRETVTLEFGEVRSMHSLFYKNTSTRLRDLELRSPKSGSAADRPPQS